MNLFSFQMVKLATSSPDEDGVIVFIDGCLIAILSKLAADCHGALKGQWFIEVGFGQCDASLAPPSFRLPSEALSWIAAETGDDARVTDAELTEIDRRMGACSADGGIARGLKSKAAISVRQTMASGMN